MRNLKTDKSRTLCDTRRKSASHKIRWFPHWQKNDDVWVSVLIILRAAFLMTAPLVPQCQTYQTANTRAVIMSDFPWVRTKDFLLPNKPGFKSKYTKVEGREQYKGVQKNDYTWRNIEKASTWTETTGAQCLTSALHHLLYINIYYYQHSVLISGDWPLSWVHIVMWRMHRILCETAGALLGEENMLSRENIFSLCLNCTETSTDDLTSISLSHLVTMSEGVATVTVTLLQG